mmetsp:Transcript_4377/g.11187  ORF Transcript_4377/g.11187 Transcript_4377/m.11187 type:complete len:135 (+) Transcript_4377:18-422(+)
MTRKMFSSWAAFPNRAVEMAGIPAQCIGSSLVAAGAIAATLALHESSIPKTCIVGSQVVLATCATLAVHHIDLRTMPHSICAVGSVAALAGAGYAAAKHTQWKDEIEKIPKKCYIGTLGGIVLVVAGAIFLSRK